MGDEIQVFTAENLPSDPETWSEWLKTRPTRMIRIEGPFKVRHPDGTESPTCDDGYLAIDFRTPPVAFPVPKRVVDQCYVEVPPAQVAAAPVNLPR